MKRFVIVLVIIGFGTANVAAQTQRPLKIGDTLPDLVLEMINYKTPQARLSDFKGRLLVLDFWTTSCKACIEAFPHLTRLQQRFGDSIRILPMGFDFRDSSSVRRFISKVAGTSRAITLPVAVQHEKDSTLMEWFPFVGLPHEVWIGQEGTVLGITGADAVRAENISGILAGHLPEFLPKRMSSLFDPEVPLLMNGNGGPDSVALIRSIFTRNIDSIFGFGLQEFVTERYTRLYMANSSLYSFYEHVYSKLKPEFGKNLLIDYLDKRTLQVNMDPKWKNDFKDLKRMSYDQVRYFYNKQVFCYDLILPPGRPVREAYQRMIRDLDDLYQVRSVVEKRTMPVLKLVKINERHAARLRDTVQPRDHSDKNNYHLLWNKESMELVANQFTNFFWNLPVVLDKTGIKGLISIDLMFGPADTLPTIRSKLRTYGLDLVPGNERMDMLVLYSMK